MGITHINLKKCDKKMSQIFALFATRAFKKNVYLVDKGNII